LAAHIFDNPLRYVRESWNGLGSTPSGFAGYNGADFLGKLAAGIAGRATGCCKAYGGVWTKAHVGALAV
jgi:hypothetical protein